MTIYKEMSYSWKRYGHFKTMKFFFNLTEFKHKHLLFVKFHAIFSKNFENSICRDLCTTIDPIKK